MIFQALNAITILAGIVSALIATICFNLAFVLQKKGLKEGPKIKIEEGLGSIAKSFREFFKNKSWVTGFFLGIIGWFPYIIAMGLVGILVVQPVMTIGLIINVIAANKILSEKISSREIMAIIALGSSTVLVVFSGISDVKIDLHAFVLPLILFLTIILSISIVCYILSAKKRGTNLEGIFIMFTCAFIYPLGAIFTNILAQAILDAQVFPLFFWEIIFGIFWFEYYHLWVFLGFWGMVIFNVVSLVFLQSALQRSKAIVVIPIQNAFVLIIPIIAGLFVFQQGFDNYFLFTTAIILILLSSLFLSKFQAELEQIE